jgi:Pyridoxamine 5'-phosphate oxidase
MPTVQGDIGLLNEPVAQRLLQSRIPARLAYVWSDGTPRVVPIGFHWNGSELVLGTPPDAPKVKVLADGTPVALTIDGDEMPYQVLMVRGTTRSDVVDGIAPEYAAMCRRTLGEDDGQAWLDQLGPMCPQMVRISISPTWVGLIDFQTRFPSAVERAMERLQTRT